MRARLVPQPEGTAGEAALAARWAAGLRGPLRLEDGRTLRVIFPGVPGAGAGPDFRGAILEADGDLLVGDVELHVRASGWRAHGHHRDPAYAGVVLHAVAANDTGATATLHASGRAVAILVLPSGEGAPLPGFAPPCTRAAAAGFEAGAVLERLALRRLRAKAASLAPLAAHRGAGEALWRAILRALGGPANGAAFWLLGERVGLAAARELLAAGPGALEGALLGAAAGLPLRRQGFRPAAAPAARLAQAARLAAFLWPADAAPAWPAPLVEAAALPAALARGGLGRAAALEVSVNAVLPAGLTAGRWSDGEALAVLSRLPSPGTYGLLRPLEGWLGTSFRSAAALQGALLLHREYCTRGACGRCPLSS